MHLNVFDQLIEQADNLLRTFFPPAIRVSARPNPAKDIPNPVLSTKEREHVAGLMRVNHAGEICAQALYLGQGLRGKSIPLNYK